MVWPLANVRPRFVGERLRVRQHATFPALPVRPTLEAMKAIASRVEHAVGPLAPPMQARRYQVSLRVRFISTATGHSGEGVTTDISRRDVRLLTFGGKFQIGESLHFLIAFPSAGARQGAVAMCRGRVEELGNIGRDGRRVVVVTIEHHSLRSASRAASVVASSTDCSEQHARDRLRPLRRVRPVLGHAGGFDLPHHVPRAGGRGIASATRFPAGRETDWSWRAPGRRSPGGEATALATVLETEEECRPDLMKRRDAQRSREAPRPRERNGIGHRGTREIMPCRHSALCRDT